MKYVKYIILLSFLVLTSCSDTPNKTKSDLEMYREMVGYNASSEFAKFSDSFVDLHSNHPSSVYLERAFLIAISNSIELSEFNMAKFYLTKMKSQFINNDNRDFYEFNELKISFLTLKTKHRNQKEFLDLKIKAEDFINKYQNSDYRFLAMDIKTSIDANLYLINAKISKLYDKRNNKYSSLEYANKNKKLNLQENDIVKVKRFFLVELFE